MKLQQIETINRETQILLRLRYLEMLKAGTQLPPFADVEFRSYSQNGEDGILLFLFSIIETTSKRVVEICAGNGIECNAANLIIHHDWEGLLFDGNSQNVMIGQAYYASNKSTRLWPPKIRKVWITAENVNELVRTEGFLGEIDLLSLDVDGMDYWIWKALNVVSPRVVVLEFNNLWGPEKSLCVPYQADFTAKHTSLGPDYCGASLQAFVKLGREKGYRLIGVEKYGFNAFFLKNGIGEKVFPEISAAACFAHPFARHAVQERLKRVKDLEWVEV